MTASPSPRSATDIWRTSRTTASPSFCATKAANVAGMLDIKRLQGSGTRSVWSTLHSGTKGQSVASSGVSRNTLPLVARSPTLDAWCMDASRTHQPSQAALAATLRPRSIAVVGASPRSFAGQIVQRNCADHRFGGLIVPVNGKYTEVAGVPNGCLPLRPRHRAGRRGRPRRYRARRRRSPRRRRRSGPAR